MGIFSSDKKKKQTSLCHVATLSNKGRRPTQQDAFAVINDDESRFFAAVADGMGGMANGAQAADMAVNFITNSSRSLDGIENISVHLESLTVSVNEKVYNEFEGKAGTTLTAVIVLDDYLYWTSVGDSMIALYRDGQLIQLNHEHSYKMLVKRNALLDGELGALPELRGSDSHRLTAYIGSQELLDIDRNLYGFPLMPDDKLLLCTDGISRAIDELTMSVILKNSPKRSIEIIDDLIQHKSSPKQDNYTAVIAQVVFEL